MSDFDPSTLATQLAGYDIIALQTSIAKQTKNLSAQTKALESLRSSLTSFRTSIKALNSTTASVLKNSATMNQEGIATITARPILPKRLTKLTSRAHRTRILQLRPRTVLPLL